MISFQDRTGITSPGVSGDKSAPDVDRILIDWVSFTSSIHSVEQILELIGMSLVAWEDGYGFHGFQYRLEYGSIRIHYNDPSYIGLTAGFVFLEMSGQGCRTFETDGNGRYEDLFQLCLRDIDKPPKERSCRITRLDLAFDDVSGHLDILEIYDAVRDQNFTSRMKDSHFHGGSVGGVTGYSVDFGSRSSNVFIRIYDKAAERGYNKNDCKHWVRCELQLRQENAMGFLHQSVDVSMSEMFKSVLSNYLTFRDPNPSDTNKRRWTVSEWWRKFLDDAIPRGIWSRPGSEYNLSKLEAHLFQRNGGALKTFVRLKGENSLLRNIREATPSLNPNYRRLIAQDNERIRREREFFKSLENRDPNREAAELRARRDRELDQLRINLKK